MGERTGCDHRTPTGILLDPGLELVCVRCGAVLLSTPRAGAAPPTETDERFLGMRAHSGTPDNVHAIDMEETQS